MSIHLREPAAVARAIELFRLSFDLAVKPQARGRAASVQPSVEAGGS